METLKLLEARISRNLYNRIEEKVNSGLFSTKSEVVNNALKKAFAEDTREKLRKLIRRKKITKKSLLSEWKKGRN